MYNLHQNIIGVMLMMFSYWYFLFVTDLKGSWSKVFSLHELSSSQNKVYLRRRKWQQNFISWYLNNSNSEQVYSVNLSPKKFREIYLNFHCHLPTDYKKVLIDTLLHCSYNICSDYASFHQEILSLKSVWQKNSFPYFSLANASRNFWISCL